MKTLAIRDGCFFGKNSATLGGDRAAEAPELIRWARMDRAPADVYTDICIREAPAGLNAVAWLIEPPSMPGKAGHYAAVEANRRAFRCALTYRVDLLYDPFYRFYPHGGAWVHPVHVPVKGRLLSIIGSEKNLSQGHLLRNEAIDSLNGWADIYGRSYHEVASKTEALAPYAFSVVIENWRADYYFTEKLIDCLLTRTIPIYWGCPGISRFFDPRGILSWKTLDDLMDIVSSLSKGMYAEMRPIIEANAREAMQYVCAEDWIARAYPDLLESRCAS
jgi:hypothetical protein